VLTDGLIPNRYNETAMSERVSERVESGWRPFLMDGPKGMAAVGEGEPAGRDYRRARELLWMAAHDLSAPLAAIRMIAHPRTAAEDDEASRRALSRIDRIAENAQRMIDDVLAIERLGAHPRAAEPEALLDAEKVLADVVVSNGPALERAACTIFVKRTDDLDRVVGRWSRAALERLFGNLIQNVVRHAPGAPIEISFARRNGLLQIHFTDGGPGLPVDAAAPGAAFAAGATDGGHGLGLWIVYRTVAEMGGAVIMESGAGKGLTFDIRLPFGE
jgi:signal transduction histidine kinase